MTLTDIGSDGKKYTTSQKVELIVLAKNTSDNGTDTNGEYDDRFQVEGVTLYEKQLKILTAYIQNIDVEGKVTIIFDADMVIPPMLDIFRMKDSLRFFI